MKADRRPRPILCLLQSRSVARCAHSCAAGGRFGCGLTRSWFVRWAVCVCEAEVEGILVTREVEAIEEPGRRLVAVLEQHLLVGLAQVELSGADVAGVDGDRTDTRRVRDE